MSLPSVKLNDGTTIPVLGFGTGSAQSRKDVADLLVTAYKAGYHHIDTAANYQNEASTGAAIKALGIERSDIYVTSKLNTPYPDKAVARSLKELDLPFVDLYLIHKPDHADTLGLQGCWQEMEKIQKSGLARSVGVSNYRVDQLEELMKGATVTPAVNQIELHPYVYEATKPLLEYCQAHSIVIEAYGPLRPLTKAPGGPVDAVVRKIGEGMGATDGQVLLKWAQQVSRGVVITTSSKEGRMVEQLKAFTELRPLTKEEVDEISAAGARQHIRTTQMQMDLLQ